MLVFHWFPTSVVGEVYRGYHMVEMSAVHTVVLVGDALFQHFAVQRHLIGLLDGLHRGRQMQYWDREFGQGLKLIIALFRNLDLIVIINLYRFISVSFIESSFRCFTFFRPTISYFAESNRYLKVMYSSGLVLIFLIAANYNSTTDVPYFSVFASCCTHQTIRCREEVFWNARNAAIVFCFDWLNQFA